MICNDCRQVGKQTWRRAIAEARRAVDLMPSAEDRAVGERVIAVLTAKAAWDKANP